MELTPSELTILGLIVEQPRHGWDIEQVIEQRGIRQWTDIGFSSIYYLLTKLEKRGLIAARRSGPGAKSRRVLHATDSGRRAAATAARALIAEARPAPHPLLVGLANSSLLPRADYDACLQDRLARLDARMAAVADAERSQAPLPPAAREVFSLTRHLLAAERSWLAERIEDSHA